MKFIYLLSTLGCLLLFSRMEAQPCIVTTDSIGRVYPSDRLPDMQVGVAFDAQVRAILYSSITLPPITVVFDSFGLNPNLVFPSGLQLECPLNSSYCMAYPFADFLRLCYRLHGTPTVQNASYPGYDSILIIGTYSTDIPLFAPILDTMVLYYRISEGVNVAVRNENEVQSLGITIDPATAQAVVSYSLVRPQEVQFEVCDLFGRCTNIQRERGGAGNNQLEINLSNISPGVYFLKASINTGEMQATKKFAWIR